MTEQRECKHCHVAKPLTGFHRQGTKYRHRVCKTCRNGADTRKRGNRPQKRIIERIRYPNKLRAWRALEYAKRRGLITQPKACQSCDVETNKLQAHHKDYAFPLDVTWLCISCHQLTHRSEAQNANP